MTQYYDYYIEFGTLLMLLNFKTRRNGFSSDIVGLCVLLLPQNEKGSRDLLAMTAQYNITFEDEDSSFDTPTSNSDNSRWNETLRFPRILHHMLEDADRNGFSHIISWLPDQRTFKVKNNGLFVQQVLPVYCRQTQFKSFQRQLNLWGFERVHSGPNVGGYTHMFFIRGQPNLCQRMKRIKTKQARVTSSVTRMPRKSTTSQPSHLVPPKLNESNSSGSDGFTLQSSWNSARQSGTVYPLLAQQSPSTTSSRTWNKGLPAPGKGKEAPISTDLFDEETLSSVLHVLPTCPRNCTTCAGRWQR